MRLEGRGGGVTGAGAGRGAAGGGGGGGGRGGAGRADVSRAADNQLLVEKALAAWGRLDVFFANAGVPQFPTPIEAQDEATFDRIIAVNVKGVWLGAKYALAVMNQQKRGV